MLICTFAIAQHSKNTLYLSLSSSFRGETTNTRPNSANAQTSHVRSDLFLAAKGGTFLMDQLLFGLEAYFDQQRQQNFVPDRRIGIGLFSRLYVTDELFGGVKYLFESENTTLDDINTSKFGFIMGSSFMFNDKIAFEPELAYLWGGNLNPVRTFSLSVGVGLFIAR